jgi:hypothetical protein
MCFPIQIRVLKILYICPLQGVTLYMEFSYLNRVELRSGLGNRKDRCLLSVAERKRTFFAT